MHLGRLIILKALIVSLTWILDRLSTHATVSNVDTVRTNYITTSIFLCIHWPVHRKSQSYGCAQTRKI